MGVHPRNEVAKLFQTVFAANFPIRADPQFFKGGGWYLGVAESMERVTKMLPIESSNPAENRFTRDTTNATK